MKTIEVSVVDLIKLKVGLENFVYEDRNSCDCCMYCGEQYGNARLIEERGGKLKHDADCPVLIVQDMSTGL